jgi:hypothetical protein
MFVSKDFKNLFISNPRTGTKSIRTVFAPHVYMIEDPHSTHFSGHMQISECIRILTQQKINFNQEQIEKIFVFWRDPVEKFISAVNHLNDPQVFNDLTKKITAVPGFTYSRTVNFIPDNATVDTMTPEYVAYNFLPKLDSSDSAKDIISLHFSKQTRWIVPSEKLQVLNYANYEDNFRTMAGFFGVDPNIEIPREHESVGGYTSLSASTEAVVREYYAEDYALI